MAGDSLETVLANLNREIRAIEGRSISGLLAAGLKVQALAQQRVPVEHGQLRASAYTRRDGSGVVVGFSAPYAVYVHENMQMKWRGLPRRSGIGVYWGPSGQSKYLQSAVVELNDDILRTVQHFADVANREAAVLADLTGSST